MNYVLHYYNNELTVDVRSEDYLENISEFGLTGGKLEYIAELVAPDGGR